jgi:hypothetical protein
MTDLEFKIELAKIGVSILLPLVVAIVGLVINRRLQRLASIEENRGRLVEKRTEIYDEIGFKLNDLYCYYLLVGDWKSMDRHSIRATKRKLDRLVHTYRPFFSRAFFDAYDRFMAACFVTYTGMGEDARLRTRYSMRPEAQEGNDEAYARQFTDENNSESIKVAYVHLLGVLGADLNLTEASRK